MFSTLAGERHILPVIMETSWMHKSSHGTVRHFLMFSMITARSLASVLPEASCTTCNSSSPQPAVMAFPPGEASVKLPAFQQPQTKSTPKLFVFSFICRLLLGKLDTHKCCEALCGFLAVGIAHIHVCSVSLFFFILFCLFVISLLVATVKKMCDW